MDQFTTESTAELYFIGVICNKPQLLIHPSIFIFLIVLLSLWSRQRNPDPPTRSSHTTHTPHMLNLKCLQHVRTSAPAKKRTNKQTKKTIVLAAPRTCTDPLYWDHLIQWSFSSSLNCCLDWKWHLHELFLTTHIINKWNVGLNRLWDKHVVRTD